MALGRPFPDPEIGGDPIEQPGPSWSCVQPNPDATDELALGTLGWDAECWRKCCKRVIVYLKVDGASFTRRREKPGRERVVPLFI